MDKELLKLRQKVAKLVNKEEWDDAILLLNKFIDVATNPKDKAIGYAARGIAYHNKRQPDRMFKDTVEATKRDEKLRLTNPVFYMAYKVNLTSLSEDGKIKLFRHCIKLVGVVRRIQEKLCYEPEGGEIAHYTSLDSLKLLGDTSCFRLYNAAYMNDPEEGQTFFEIMNDDKIMNDDTINVEEVFYKNSATSLYPSPAYIGSFVRVDSQSKEKDKLFLWRTYGKQDGEEATGSCLIFQRNLFLEKSTTMRIGAMHQLENPEKIEPALYRIAYKSDCKKNNDDLPEKLKELAGVLGKIKKFKESKKEEEEEVNELVHELLDVIRFLFKADHYASENEARVILMSYDVENIGQTVIKLDMDKTTPRFYMELSENIHFNEVILGPNARGISEWTYWLKERDEDIKVCQSRIKYGEQYL